MCVHILDIDAGREEWVKYVKVLQKSEIKKLNFNHGFVCVIHAVCFIF